MTKYIQLFIFFLTLSACGQNKKTDVCESEIVELILAYEYDGQCQLDDMIFKFPELIEYNLNNVNSKNYKSGVYQFYSSETDFNKIKNCLTNLNHKTVSEFINPFHEFDTKIVSYKNKAFSGKGITMLGDEELEWKYHEFKYKILKVKFERTYIGIESRTIVNIDRKNKSDEETLTINCPIYIMTKIINISSIE